MRKLLLMSATLLACSGAWAEETQLVCSGEISRSDENGNVRDTTKVLDVRFNEQENYVKITGSDNDTDDCRDVKFTPSTISCHLKGDIGTLGSKKMFEIDRYSGILTRVSTFMGAKQTYSLQCRAVEKEKLF